MAEQIVREVVDGEWKTIAAPGGGGGSQTVLSSTVDLSSSDILGLQGSPPLSVVAVPAPAADEVIVVLQAFMSTQPGNVAYHQNAQLILEFDPTAAGQIPLNSCSSALTNAVAAFGLDQAPFTGGLSDTTDQFAGLPLGLGGAFTLGNGTARLTVLYSIATLL